MLSKKEKLREEKRRAYAWVSYMLTHEPEEMRRVRKYGTPSDWLIEHAKNSRAFVHSDGKSRRINFPYSLNKASGQKKLYEILLRVEKHIKSLPIKAFELLNHVKVTVRHRRSDTQSNIHMVAEAILHRVATEFKAEVLFAFDSINTWIKSVYGKELGYHTIRKALEYLHEQEIIRVNEWGVRGNRCRATKIEILPITRKTTLIYTSELDDWLLFNDHAMTAVYRRESTTRQDVLEQAIHFYAETVLLNEDTLYVDDLLRHSTMEELLFRGRVKMTEVEFVETEKVNNDHFTRLLGQLVPTVQEDDSVGGEAIRGIRDSVSESRSGPPREQCFAGATWSDFASYLCDAE